MSDHTMIWLVILAGGLASYVFRSLPQLVLSRLALDPGRSAVLRFFDYAAYAVIGGIVASALFGGGGDLLAQLRSSQVQAGLVGVAVAFAAVLYGRGQLLSLALGVAAYQLVRLLGG